MGDRTTVTLTVLQQQSEQAATLFPCPADEADVDSNDNCEFVFHECNYGDPGCLEALQSAGTAFDSRWAAGSNYGPGKTSCRFTELGEHIEKEVYEDTRNPDLDELVKRIDDPAGLRKYILIHQESVTSLPLDENQIEYGKRYLARKLIDPNTK